jgi:hypothetical protein
MLSETDMPLASHSLTRLALACAFMAPALAAAAPAAGTAYRTDAQSSHVEDATSRGVNQVNMITCIMSSMRPDALVNQGNYIALVDQNKCDPESRSSSANSGSSSAGTNAPSYLSATVAATRTSNDEPMSVKAWINEESPDFQATIFVSISASEAPSAGNPYGVFRLDYCGKGDVGGCMMNGYLEGAADGISYFEVEEGDNGQQSKALRLTTSGNDSGAGALQMSEGGNPVAYSFAYNADYFRRFDGTNDQCFSRDAADPGTAMSVWRYGLYDADSGARVTRQSGFPIEYTAGGHTYNGHMGYWGLWLPPEAAAQIASGDTVQQVEYSNGQAPQKTDYALVKAGGRMMKYTKQTRSLAAIDKIKFNTWIWDTNGFFSGAQAHRQYEMYWDDQAGSFKVTGTIECNPNCESRDLPGGEEAVAASYFANLGGLRGWSQALGGELFVALAGVSGTPQSGDIEVIYRVQDLVYPAQMPATLHCLRDCPTAATLAAYFEPGSQQESPFVAATFNRFQPADGADVVTYTTAASQAMLRDGASGDVVYTSAAGFQERPQFQWGVRTGRLFTTLEAAQCQHQPSQYCEQQVEQLDTYYQWETGANQWNQFAAVKDGNGEFVTFEAPLNVDYSVPAGTQYGQYAGKDIVLQYGGFGELWGIPGHCVSRLTNERVSCETQDSRYVPAFVIPFDEVLGRVHEGGRELLVKWLDREIRFARKDVAECSNAGVTLPSGLTLPSAAGLTDPSTTLGDQPGVTEAPRVIHGEVKY